jgi:hypothetical protein
MALLTDLAVWGMEQGGLTSTIPTVVGTLTNLVFLDFDFNNLTGSLPTELFLLTNLNQLDLNNNQLTGNVEPIGALVNLDFLQLHSKLQCVAFADVMVFVSPFSFCISLVNLFTGTLPDEMGNLTAMRTFTLYDTFFSGTMPASVCSLRDSNGGLLRTLTAECDDIPGVGPQIVCETPECCSDCRGLPPNDEGN